MSSGPWRGARPCTTSGAVSIEAPDSMSSGTCLSICAFHLSVSLPTEAFDNAVSPRFQPVRSMSPPHVSHSWGGRLWACATSDPRATATAADRHGADDPGRER